MRVDDTQEKMNPWEYIPTAPTGNHSSSGRRKHANGATKAQDGAALRTMWWSLFSLSSDVESLNEKLGRKRLEARELRKTLGDQQTRADELQYTVDSLSKELIAERLEKKYYLDDHQVRSHWAALDYKIDHIVKARYRLRPGPTSGKPLGSDRLAHGLRHLADEPESWLRDRLRRPYLFKAFIWNELVQKVFGERGTLWAGPGKAGKVATRRVFEQWTSKCGLDLAASLTTNRTPPPDLLEEGSMSVQEHQDMRARHTGLMYRAYGIDHDSVAEISKEIEGRLFEGQRSDLERNGHGNGNGNGSVDACPSMNEVIFEAAELDARLRMCRPWYQIFMYDPRETLLRPVEEDCEWSTFGMGYEGRLMADMEGQPLPSVALVVSPALVKRGNAKGEGYEEVLVLAPRQVLCRGPGGNPHVVVNGPSERERDIHSTGLGR